MKQLRINLYILCFAWIFVIFIYNSANARNFNRYVTFSVQSGMNKSRFINYDGSQGRIGSINNISLRIGRSQFIQFTGELGIYQSKITKQVNSISVTNNFNIGYLTFPLTYGYRLGFNESKSYGVRFHAGPELGTSIWVKDNRGDISRGDVKKLMFNLIGGMGLDFKRFTVDFVFHQGLTNTLTSKSKWQVLSLATGWRF